MIDLDELEFNGWSLIDGVDCPSAMLEVAHSIGQPIPSPTGALIRRIKITDSVHARPQTLSAAFGVNRFPLHTDTAFWVIPARFLIMRANGDVRRQTTLLRFRDLIAAGLLDPQIIKRSVWNVKTPSTSRYSLMRFRCGNTQGWRFDSQCMFPANDMAKVATQLMQSSRIDDLIISKKPAGPGAMRW
jgi:hypothetical protein